MSKLRIATGFFIFAATVVLVLSFALNFLSTNDISAKAALVSSGLAMAAIVCGFIDYKSKPKNHKAKKEAESENTQEDTQETQEENKSNVK